MRKVLETQLKIGQQDIPNIKVDIDSRDELPQLLLGLQAIYANCSLRHQVFSILKNIVPLSVDTANGRPGMDLWKILVLGTIRLSCNYDYDKLHDTANNHKAVREFLGHTILEFDQTYSLQTIKDNIALFTPEILDQISTVVIKAGHKMMVAKTDQVLKGRCDSFVVETNVHYPTDINLLLDAIRKIVFLMCSLCNDLGISEWRQYRHIFKKIKRLFTVARKLNHSTSKDDVKKAIKDQQVIEAHRQFVDLVESYILRAKQCIGVLSTMDIMQMANIMRIEKFIEHGQRQIDQIRRRVLNGETIGHHEKVFSIFQEHTEWISKGKAGVPQELGLGVCILEDQYGFILHHHVMEHQKDVHIAVQMVAEAKRKFSALSVSSFDKGFYSPDNRKDLCNYLDQVVLPRKGRLSEKDKLIEHSDEFIAARRKHSAVESAINALENHGLDRCPDNGIFGFKRYVALSVLARNLQILGAMIRKKQLKQRKQELQRAA